MFIERKTTGKDPETFRKRTGNNTLSERFPTKEKVLKLFLDKNNLQTPVRTRKIGDMIVADFEKEYFLLYAKKGKPNHNIETDTENREECRTLCNARLYCGEYHTKKGIYQFTTELLKIQREKESRTYSSRRIDKNKRFWFLDN